jgi:hypothetical protein
LIGDPDRSTTTSNQESIENGLVVSCCRLRRKSARNTHRISPFHFPPISRALRPGRNYRLSVAFKAPALAAAHTYGEASTCLVEIKLDIRQAAKHIGGLSERRKI